jgi:hypothetical protein
MDREAFPDANRGIQDGSLAGFPGGSLANRHLDILHSRFYASGLSDLG